MISKKGIIILIVITAAILIVAIVINELVGLRPLPITLYIPFAVAILLQLNSLDKILKAEKKEKEKKQHDSKR